MLLGVHPRHDEDRGRIRELFVMETPAGDDLDDTGARDTQGNLRAGY